MDRKSRIIEIYGILLTDCCCVVLSYLLALLLRYGSFAAVHHKNTYVLVCVWILLFTVLYDTLIGSGRNFLRRGYYVEAKSVAKHVTGLLIFLGCSLFFFKEAENFSRLVFGYFFLLEAVMMFVCHVLLKKYLRAHYQADRSRTKVMAITDRESAEKILSALAAGADYDCEISAAVIWDHEIGRAHV